jgi:hypothetical protein
MAKVYSTDFGQRIRLPPPEQNGPLLDEVVYLDGDDLLISPPTLAIVIGEHELQSVQTSSDIGSSL